MTEKVNNPIDISSNSLYANIRMNSKNPVIASIKNEIKKGKSLRQVAREAGLSAPFLHDLINERRGVSVRVGAIFGFEWRDGTWRKIKVASA